jgi:hypothetical protein
MATWQEPPPWTADPVKDRRVLPPAGTWVALEKSYWALGPNWQGNAMFCPNGEDWTLSPGKPGGEAMTVWAEAPESMKAKNAAREARVGAVQRDIILVLFVCLYGVVWYGVWYGGYVVDFLKKPVSS